MRVRAVVVVVVAACHSSFGHSPDARSGDAAGSGDAPAPVLPASDTFRGTTLDPSWTILDPSKVTATVNNGLVLVPAANALWFDAGVGGLVYKLVTGDFTATATVHARKASNAAMPPDQAIELGGVMARDPNGSAESYVFVVIGFGEQNQLAVEHKSTANSTSTFAEMAFAPDAELRLCRQGATFSLYVRAVGAATWTPDFSIARADLPATLQVGPNAYDGEAAPDVAISFDGFTFAAVVGGDCTR
jgi:hypothetical protein